MYSRVCHAVTIFAARARTGHIVMVTYLQCFQLVGSPFCRVCKAADETSKASYEDRLLAVSYN